MDGLVGKELTLQVNGSDYTMPELLAYWIRERESIRLKKEEGLPKPWSDDWVFQETYFCNVRREDDKVTRWVRQNYTPGFMGAMYEFSICVARIFNRPETLELIKHPVRHADFAQMRSVLEEMQRLKQQIWSGAYLITTHGRKMTKLDYCLEILEAAHRHMFAMKAPAPVTCDWYYRYIMHIEGFGSFLSAQVVADLKNTKGHPLVNATDWKTFSAPGPGSLRGLSWWHGRRVPETSYHNAIREVAADLQDYEEIPFEIHMQDLQNCLCEFDKYCRVLSGSGRSKRKYDGK